MGCGTIISALTLFVISRCDSHAFFRTNEAPDPDEVTKSYGYYAERHTVTTPDGYILTLHRVVSPKVDLNSSPDPFILQHGLTSNSAQWVVLEPKKNLACMLADNGFDVWMTNIRGNMYSRKHERLSPSNLEFWDYSWHEHGTIDMPAIIDYILNKTKHKQLWYAGHSMGTTMFFVMGSMRPEYNSKIKHMFALAPVAYMSHVKADAKILAPHVRTLRPLLTSTLNGHLETDALLLQITKHGICRTIGKPCATAVNSVFGPNPRSNITVLFQAMRYMPDYVSLRQISHYGQLMNLDFTFRSFDYYEQNTAKYKAPEPPRYPVEKITAPLTFLYSKNDYFAETVDVETFARKLRNVKMYLVPDPKFNHIDFIFASYADELVYKPMLKMIQEERMRSTALPK